MYKKTKTKKEKYNMKNVKILLIFMITSTLLLASAQRVNSLGGNVGYWADDDNSWTAFPHTLNNSNLAQVSGLGSTDDHNAIVRWGEGTKWGFSWNQANENDMLNLQWGNGSMGATFGLAMSADGDEDSATPMATAGMGLSASFGMEIGFGELGVGFSNATYDDGDAATANDPASMGLWVNLRRAQSVWLFDNMLVNFNYDANNSDADFMVGNVDGQTTMMLGTSFYSHIDISDNTTGLIAMGFGYTSYANNGNVKDAAITNIALPTWTFAVESSMTDWATCRMSVNAGYILSNSSTAGTGAKDVTGRGGMDTDFSVGLGFNYGSFNLDVDVSEGLFTNPVQHVTGYESITPAAGGTATLTYVW
jgi:hypothetical protein